MDKNIHCLLGLAFRGGNIIVGDATLSGLQKKRVKMVLVANDASLNTIKKWQDKCAFYQVRCLLFGTKEELGQALGKSFISVLAILEKNLASKMEKLMKDGDIYGTKEKV